MESTWETRDLLVLDAVVRLFETKASSPLIGPDAIQEATGFDEAEVQAALRAIGSESPRLIAEMSTSASGHIFLVGSPTGEARRRVGAWPTPDSLTDRFAAAFTEAADTETEPERKGRLRRGAEAFSGVGKEVAAEVIAKVITQGM